MYKGGLLNTQLTSPWQCLLLEPLESTAGLSEVATVSVREQHAQDILEMGSELPGWAPGPCPPGQWTMDKRIIKLTLHTSTGSPHGVNEPMEGGRAEILALPLTSLVPLGKPHPFPGSGVFQLQNGPTHRAVMRREQDKIRLRDCCIVSAQ